MNRAIRSDRLDAPADVAPPMRGEAAAGSLPDNAVVETESSAWPTSYALAQAARAYRSRVLGELVSAAISKAYTMARRAYAAYRQRREARLTLDALDRLDDRSLRDLGLDRSEIASVAAEITGAAEHTRVYALQSVRRERTSSDIAPRIDAKNAGGEIRRRPHQATKRAPSFGYTNPVPHH